MKPENDRDVVRLGATTLIPVLLTAYPYAFELAYCHVFLIPKEFIRISFISTLVFIALLWGFLILAVQISVALYPFVLSGLIAARKGRDEALKALEQLSAHGGNAWQPGTNRGSDFIIFALSLLLLSSAFYLPDLYNGSMRRGITVWIVVLSVVAVSFLPFAILSSIGLEGLPATIAPVLQELSASVERLLDKAGRANAIVILMLFALLPVPYIMGTSYAQTRTDFFEDTTPSHNVIIAIYGDTIIAMRRASDGIHLCPEYHIIRSGAFEMRPTSGPFAIGNEQLCRGAEPQK